MISSRAMLSSDKLNLEKLHFLLVDDNASALNIVTQIISGFGAKHITKVQTVAAAKAVIRSHAVDFILTDAQMPDEDGYSFMKWLRTEASEPNRFCPSIILTGHTRRSQVLQARDCGAHFIIAKPLTPSVLLERIFWVAREERMFIDCDTYKGPDRRFHNLGPPEGMEGRRVEDQEEGVHASGLDNGDGDNNQGGEAA